MRKEIKKYYENCFKENEFKRPILEGVRFNQLTLENRHLLKYHFSVDEVNEFVGFSAKEKSHGLYGFNIGFFKDCWKIIKNDVIDFVNEFHTFSKVPKAVATDFLALIPKNK